MKKLLLLLPFLFIFNGCGDDDEDWLNLDGHPIVGTWKLVDMEYSTKPTTPELEKVLKEAMSGVLEEIGVAEITFSADGKFKMDVGVNGTGSGTYRVSNSKVELTVDGGKSESTFKINGNKMTVEEDITAEVNKELADYELGSFKFDRVTLIESYERVK